MSDQRDGGIAWTDQTWNPVRGCSRVSEGCRHCYAETMAARFSGKGQPYEGLARMTDAGPRWTGEARLVQEHLLDPIRWKRPRRIFVNSMSDLFHEKLSDEAIDQVFGVMLASAVLERRAKHTFQILTKRADRMYRYFSAGAKALTARWCHAGDGLIRLDNPNVTFAEHVREPVFPLPNVWLGVSVEDQRTADERIPLLLECPAAVRWISAEPLLGPLDVGGWLGRCLDCDAYMLDHRERGTIYHDDEPRLDWVVVGGESGPGSRPMHPSLARGLRDQCDTAGVPFFFKQWGDSVRADQMPEETWVGVDAAINLASGHAEDTFRVGKKAAGDLLDEVKHQAFPEGGGT